jgi:hypothetical protein
MSAFLADDIDEHVPDPQVCKEFNITAMTIWRWDRNPELVALGWPPPMYVSKRKYRSRRQLEKFKAALMQKAIERRQKGAEIDEHLSLCCDGGPMSKP